MTNAAPNAHSLLTRILAKPCAPCPLCRCARAHPATRLGRTMAWRGTWCPAWKAHQRVHNP